ncbi:hypothetical protein CPC08DRAFT_340067 [Agrocybe pediades]|nr:hypothetical protein CPC08DRAFT_340067 [Agrocybe pediades]
MESNFCFGYPLAGVCWLYDLSDLRGSHPSHQYSRNIEGNTTLRLDILGTHKRVEYYHHGPPNSPIANLALLIWRIWQIDRTNQSNIVFSNEYTTESSQLLRNVMVIIIESGFLYTSSAFATFITLLYKSNAIYVTTGSTPGLLSHSTSF